MEVIFFSVGGASYLAPLTSLAEVLMPAALRAVPAGPPFLRGLLNLRGRALPVIDLRERLGLPAADGFRRRNRVLRVPTASGEFGVLVDAVQRIAVLDEAQRRDDANGSGAAQGFAGPFWEIDTELIQELKLDCLLRGDEMLALGWKPAHGQTDFNRLLDPAAGEAEPS